MKTKPFLIGFFAAVVAVVAVSAYIGSTIERTDKAVESVKSPEGRYKAVRVSLTRAGNPLFCVDSIAVFLAVYPDNFAESDKVYEIYSAPCATPAGRVPTPKLEWLSNTALRITYSPPPAADRGKVTMKPLDASKYVHITYVAR